MCASYIYFNVMAMPLTRAQIGATRAIPKTSSVAFAFDSRVALLAGKTCPASLAVLYKASNTTHFR